jgi:GT2 family glycosyltransferase
LHPLTPESVREEPRLSTRTRGALWREGREAPGTATQLPRIAAIVVTWNRSQRVDQVLQALSRQAYARERLDVVVVDNASTDGTGDALIERWRPEIVADNPTQAAHQPDYRIQHGGSNGQVRARNRGGFASLTLVRNVVNHGGCGGFNTGLAFLEQFLDTAAQPLDYAWLVDDDVDLPADALHQLVGAAESDERIGIVGSRTVDFDRRDTTTETTIYFDYERGWMDPDPTPPHPMYQEHQRWLGAVGSTRGMHAFSGIRDVDMVSACSLLARWSAVKRIGFWDHRYFIYCDDADWCLRFRGAGYRVVCNLDAVVYHTFWMTKLTPARGYYSQRNLIWVIQKTLRGLRLKRAVFRRLGALLLQSLKAMTHCRLYHAEIIRRTAHDVVTGRGGRLDFEGPPAVPLMQALEQAGALVPEARIMVMCSHHDSIGWADDLRARVTHALLDRQQLERQPRWIYMVREDVPHRPGAGGGTMNATAAPAQIVFERNRKSKLRMQRGLLLRPPDAVVIFDQNNEFPLLHSRLNIHLDGARPSLAQVERDGPLLRARFLLRLSWTSLVCLAWAALVRHRTHAGKYG